MEWWGPFTSCWLWGVGQGDWVVISGIWPLVSLACKWNYLGPWQPGGFTTVTIMHICFYKHISEIAFYKIIKYVYLNEFDCLSLHPWTLGNIFFSKEENRTAICHSRLSLSVFRLLEIQSKLSFYLVCLHSPSKILADLFVLFS